MSQDEAWRRLVATDPDFLVRLQSRQQAAQKDVNARIRCRPLRRQPREYGSWVRPIAPEPTERCVEDIGSRIRNRRMPVRDDRNLAVALVS